MSQKYASFIENEVFIHINTGGMTPWTDNDVIRRHHSLKKTGQTSMPADSLETTAPVA
jgi:hypothetical protein